MQHSSCKTHKFFILILGLYTATSRSRLSFPLQLLHCVFTSLQQFQTAFSVSSSAPGGISHSTSYTPASCQTPQTCSCGRERETAVFQKTGQWSVEDSLQVRGPICYFVTYDLCSITVMISFLQKPVSDKSQRLLLKSNFWIHFNSIIKTLIPAKIGRSNVWILNVIFQTFISKPQILDKDAHLPSCVSGRVLQLIIFLSLRQYTRRRQLS